MAMNGYSNSDVTGQNLKFTVSQMLLPGVLLVLVSVASYLPERTVNGTSVGATTTTMVAAVSVGLDRAGDSRIEFTDEPIDEPMIADDEIIPDGVSDIEDGHSFSVVTTINQDQPSFTDIDLVGRSSLVYDSATERVLWEENADDKLPLASLGKLMTVLLAYELMETGTIVIIEQEAIQQSGEGGLAVGETFNIKTLSDLTLLSSSNDGAYALALAVADALVPGSGVQTFVDAMNVRAGELGMTNTVFYNPTGLDIDRETAGSYGSAHDVVRLVDHILKNRPTIFESTRFTDRTLQSEIGITHITNNTNPRVVEIPGLIGSKTGYTDLAGGNLVIAFEVGANHPVIAITLGSGYDSRFDDVKTLVHETRTLMQR